MAYLHKEIVKMHQHLQQAIKEEAVVTMVDLETDMDVEMVTMVEYMVTVVMEDVVNEEEEDEVQLEEEEMVAVVIMNNMYNKMIIIKNVQIMKMNILKNELQF